MNKIKKFPKALIGFFLMLFRIRNFNSEKIFSGKRIAIVGPADSAYDEFNGEFIDQFDYVIRINKALITWKPENEKFIGTKTDILLHSFDETDFTGGGKLDFNLFRRYKVKYIINAKNTPKNYRHIFNVYKKYLTWNKMYMLSKRTFKNCQSFFVKHSFRPTNGFRAIHMVLASNCKEVYITGFTFYKTPYAAGYRDQLMDMDINLEHMKKKGVHNPDLEYSLFLDLVKNCEGKVVLDSRLKSIVENNNEKKLVD